MKISIVMTYYQRQFQLIKTLKSFLQYNPNEFDVIIIDDNSPDDIILPKLPFKINVIKISDKKWTNPEPAYNTGIKEAIKAKAEIIVLQNAECYHVGNVLNFANSIKEENYISVSCYSLNQETTFNDHNIFSIIEINNSGAVENGTNAWYNHPVYRPVGYDFCSIITSNNLIKLNGYDERFSLGCAYGDDYLLARIKMMGLKVNIPEYPFVVHQWHYNQNGVQNHAELIEKNKNLLIELVKENNYRAKHIFTEDL